MIPSHITKALADALRKCEGYVSDGWGGKHARYCNLRAEGPTGIDGCTCGRDQIDTALAAYEAAANVIHQERDMFDIPSFVGAGNEPGQVIIDGRINLGELRMIVAYLESKETDHG
jgi:hypothetical protein